MLKQLKIDLGKKHMPTWAVTNAVCCIPLTEDDDIRKPTLEEMEACRPRFYEFINICQPRLAVLLGESAIKAWKKANLHKQGFDFTDSTPICTLELQHPAYLLRNGANINRTFSENYNACLDFKRDYLKLRDALKVLTTRVGK